MFGISNQKIPFDVQLEAHATILATTSRTVLTQTFANPSTTKGIRECRYTFPLCEGVSVVGFTCHVGEREIVGEVKEKEKARAVFKEAVARGEMAGLFEQLPDASDVFTTTVGNIPPGAKVVTRVTYLGELKHDLEVDGIRFTIPTIICPRYGNYPGTLQRSQATDAMGSSISITVDAEMADGSFIQKMQSPTHPIAMTIGTTSMAPNAEPVMTKASATLTLGDAGLETDFVLQVIAKSPGVPKAILENHPIIPDHRALMATLVPKFSLPPEKPEIVFVCDRSGSMGGTRIELAKQALKVFLKSLPIGVKFNICSFGWQHTFLWPRSVTYSQQTLDEAMAHADSFAANYGGTEMLQPLKATIEQRYKDMPLEIMMLTDGEIWNQQDLFSYLNQAITESKAPIRVFTLGIGNGVSHALIEGIAKAGDGFSQTVGEGEKMDTKVVRMLKGALSPHIKDYTLEVRYNDDDISARLDVEEEDDFEIVEKVVDSLKVKLGLEEQKPVSEKSKKPISLFDPSADPDEEEPPARDETGEQRYAHLPKVFAPKIIQAPQRIPSLFAFNRTTVYLLLGPEAPQGTPKSVILRGTSAHGPLELEIPVQILDAPGETIHQLAAKKAISELEQGRGWLTEAKDESDVLIKTKYEGRFADMVEREAVRLGVQFQVGGKWCPFVAVESNNNEAERQGKQSKDWEWLEDEKYENPQIQQAQMYNAFQPVNSFGKGFTTKSSPITSLGPFGQSSQFATAAPNAGGPFANQNPGRNSTLFASLRSNSGKPSFGANTNLGAHHGITSSSSGSSLFGTPSHNQNPAPQNVGGSLFGNFGNTSGSGAFGAPSQSGSSLFGAPSQYQNLTPQNVSGSLFGSFGNASGSSAFGAPSQSGSSLFGAPNQSQSSGWASVDSALNLPTGSATQSGRSELQDYQSGLMILEQQNKNRKNLFSQSTNRPPLQATQASADGSNGPPIDVAELPQDFDEEKWGREGGAVEECNDLTQAETTRSTIDFSYAPKASEGEFTREWVIPPGFGSKPQTVGVGTHPPASRFAQNPSSKIATASPATPLEGEALLHHLISLQTFAGSWVFTSSLLITLGLDEKQVEAKTENMESVDKTVFVTALVVAVFEKRLAWWKGSWELVVDKARNWLEGEASAPVRESRASPA
ncbi:von willebrand domain-containing protein [Stemphylium lycopersici]|uniref:von Willebrand domain containing protein n=1 Tax=Stemphylium lycopersici TaxID=183478 RepID=A0A364N7P9_STELY|nr:von willebrand domain-containing protein [Stemphylium lycopersici]RAR13292.1 von Willebrand domain containing protein [Stemphylium lycopersici]